MQAFDGIAPQWLLTRSALLAMGLSDNAIRRARALGGLTTVLPGLYAPADRLPPRDAASARRAVASALLPRLAPGSVLSHLSAADLHRLPWPEQGLPGQESSAVHVTRPPPATSRRGRVLFLHRGALDPDEVVTIDRLPVTSPARTVVDCVMTLGGSDAAVLARYSVDSGLVTWAELRRQVRLRPRVPGIRAAAALLTQISPPR